MLSLKGTSTPEPCRFVVPVPVCMLGWPQAQEPCRFVAAVPKCCIATFDLQFCGPCFVAFELSTVVLGGTDVLYGSHFLVFCREPLTQKMVKCIACFSNVKRTLHVAFVKQVTENVLQPVLGQNFLASSALSSGFYTKGHLQL